jgi:hypothetical protein
MKIHYLVRKAYGRAYKNYDGRLIETRKKALTVGGYLAPIVTGMPVFMLAGRRLSGLGTEPEYALLRPEEGYSVLSSSFKRPFQLPYYNPGEHFSFI